MKKVKRYAPAVILGILFIFHLFFGFYNAREWITFGYDQVDNAWASVRILIEHTYPMVGMVAKNSSGIYIGPLYYYLVAIFYWIFNFDPIASPILAGVTSAISFIVLYIVTKKIFNRSVALWAVFIYTFCLKIILADRVQWPVNFIPMISLGIFYCLYEILQGKTRFIILLAVILGLSFHIHFTSIIYLPIILATLPFFPKHKESFTYPLFATLITIVFLTSTIWFMINNRRYVGMQNFATASFEPFHLRRFLQLAHDAFIQFEIIFPWKIFRPFVFLFPPLFYLAHFFTEPKKKTWIVSYLVTLWFLAPWITFTLFRGEITNYYFDLTRLIAVITVAYLSNALWQSKKIIIQAFLIIFWTWYVFTTFQMYFTAHENGLPPTMIEYVSHADQKGDKIPYFEGDPKSFLYYIWRWKQGLPQRP